LGWVFISGVEQVADFKSFDQTALEILQGQYLINPFRQIGPSLFFALHYHVFGYNTLYPQVSIAVLSAVQTLLVYRLIVQTTSSRTTAIISSGLLAVWPEHIIYTNLLSGDVLFCTAVLLAIWLISTSRSSAGFCSVALILGAGLTLGIAHWIRPTAPLFILIATLFLLLEPNMVWVRIRNTVYFLAATMIAIVPIMWLNQSAIGFPSPMVSQQGGWSMLVGTNVASHGWYNTEDVELLNREVARRRYNPAEHPVVFRYRIAREIAIKRLQDNPVAFLCMAFRYKITDLWRPGGLFWSMNKSRLSLLYRPICGVAAVYHVLMVLLCSAAIFRRCKPSMLKWNAVTVYIYAALISVLAHLFLEVQPRYHHMFLPLIVMYGAGLINGPKIPNLPATPTNNLSKREFNK
jgi:4-amino-4-deoxy-L-arabinose transferase-like glycosyltransferase